MTPKRHDAPPPEPTALVPPGVITSGGGGLAQALASILEIAESCREVIVAAEPHIREFGLRLNAAQEFFRHWEKHAPAALNHAIRSHGLIVPLSQMSLQDLSELLILHRDRGDAAVVERIRDHYDELFSVPEFLDTLGATWAAAPLLQRRRLLLQQALEAHKLGMFAVSIPTLIAQFEGLVADITNHSGIMRGTAMRSHVASLAASDGLTGSIFLSFVSDALLAQFGHGSLVPPFSRHAILHGGDTNYATEVNSRTAILLIDTMRVLTHPDELADVVRDTK